MHRKSQPCVFCHMRVAPYEPDRVEDDAGLVYHETCKAEMETLEPHIKAALIIHAAKATAEAQQPA